MKLVFVKYVQCSADYMNVETDMFQVTIYHLLKLFQSETDIMLGKKSLVAEFYDELVSRVNLENIWN